MKKSNFLWMMLIIFPLLSHASKHRPIDQIKECFSAKEFITVHQYLKYQKKLGVNKNKLSKIALGVSRGCGGAAYRFIKVFDILSKVELPGDKILKIANKFTYSSNYAADAFVNIFKQNYLEAYLDQNINFSADIALALTASYSGNVKDAVYDFNKLISFCISSRHLDMPRKKCAQLIREVTLNGVKTQSKVSNTFIGIFLFLTKNKNGPQLTTFKAIEIAKAMSGHGKLAEQNFIHGYKFAKSEKGLNFSIKKSLKLAKKIAEQSTVFPDKKNIEEDSSGPQR